MHEPAPFSGRGGWVLAALLIGLFAGGGIVWALLTRHPVAAPLVVYQLPAPDGTRSGGEAFSDASHHSHAHSWGQAGQTAQEQSASTGTAASSTGGQVGPVLATDAQQVYVQNNVDASPSEASINTLFPDLGPSPKRRYESNIQQNTHTPADQCLAAALNAIDPFFQRSKAYLSEEIWEGTLSPNERKGIMRQLFKGNQYCFCAATSVRGAVIRLTLYNRAGTRVEATSEATVAGPGSSARFSWDCERSGTYFVIVKLESTPQEAAVPWLMLTAYR